MVARVVEREAMNDEYTIDLRYKPEESNSILVDNEMFYTSKFPQEGYKQMVFTDPQTREGVVIYAMRKADE